MKITAEMIRKAMQSAGDMSTSWEKRLADSLNQQLEQPSDHYYWLDWSLQEAGCPVIDTLGGGEYKATFINAVSGKCININYPDIDHPNSRTTTIKPDFARRGYWVVDPANPLKRIPENLGHETVVITWLKEAPALQKRQIEQYARMADWPNVTAFMVVEP